MGEVILEKGEVLKVYFVCATAMQLQLFSFADLFSSAFMVTYRVTTAVPQHRFIFKLKHPQQLIMVVELVRVKIGCV